MEPPFPSAAISPILQLHEPGNPLTSMELHQITGTKAGLTHFPHYNAAVLRFAGYRYPVMPAHRVSVQRQAGFNGRLPDFLARHRAGGKR
jgi:hypothetical protein